MSRPDPRDEREDETTAEEAGQEPAPAEDGQALEERQQPGAPRDRQIKTPGRNR